MGKKSRLKKERRETHIAEPPASEAPSRASRKYVVVGCFIILFVAGALLRLYHLGDVESRSPDEKVHTSQAQVILDEGAVMGVRNLVKKYNANPEEWVYPKPIRVGFLWPVAALMKITGSRDVSVGAYISCFFSILSLGVIILIGVRFFNKWAALFALLFMSVSPLSLAISRRTWSDAIIGFFGMALIFMACEIIRGKKRSWYIPFAIVGGYSMMIKESGAVFFALPALWILWTLIAKEKSYKDAMIFALISSVGAALAVLLTFYASGGPAEVIDVMTNFKSALPGNTYAARYQTGPLYEFAGGFWILSPLASILFISGAVFGRKEKRGIVHGLLFFTLMATASVIITPLSQNFRYISPVFGCFYLVAGWGAWNILALSGKRLKNFSFYIATGCVVAVLIAGAIRDYRGFQRIFLKAGIPDTSVKLIRDNAR